jgi:hypothetical protein
LDTLLATFIELGGRIFFGGELLSRAIDDGTMFVWRVLGFGWHRMAMLAQDTLNVSFHQDATGALTMFLGVVPFQVHSSKFGAIPVGGHLVVFAKDCQEVLGMLLANILNAKVINDEDELDGAPLMAP